jgi:hypothetical protein
VRRYCMHLWPSPQKDNGGARRVNSRRNRGGTAPGRLALRCNRRESAARSSSPADIRTGWLTVPFSDRHPIAATLHRPPNGPRANVHTNGARTCGW